MNSVTIEWSTFLNVDKDKNVIFIPENYTLLIQDKMIKLMDDNGEIRLYDENLEVVSTLVVTPKGVERVYVIEKDAIPLKEDSIITNIDDNIIYDETHDIAYQYDGENVYTKKTYKRNDYVVISGDRNHILKCGKNPELIYANLLKTDGTYTKQDVSFQLCKALIEHGVAKMDDKMYVLTVGIMVYVNDDVLTVINDFGKFVFTIGEI